MIRDPSDGSVRDHQPKPLETKPYASGSDVLITSALAPNPIDAKESARLEKAREWIKNYHSSLSSEAVIGKRG